MLKAEKQEFVTNLRDVYGQLDSMIVTHYHGLTVAQFN